MKSQKGVTLTSVAIYVVVVLIVLGILAVISGTFQGNIKEIYAEGTNNVEIDKFNMYFIKEVNIQGNKIENISDNEVLFTSQNKYTFNSSDKSIYLNTNIKISENIEYCSFKRDSENERVIIVTIKAINGEEKIIEYVLENEKTINNDSENNYTDYNIPSNWDKTKLSEDTPIKIEIKDGVIYKAPIPEGFTTSTNPDENTITGGLVITDGSNEFVWVPVADAENYTEDSFGPLISIDNTTGYKYDCQEELDYYYGEGYYNYSDFTYETDKENVEKSIQTYGGFYVGRYETTIDNNIIGVQKGKKVLVMAELLKSGKNPTSNTPYHYRWWGLYKVQKDMYKDSNSVGSLMISAKQWNAIMSFTGYGNITRGNDTYETYLSASPYLTDNTQFDVSKNIYDLAGNAHEGSIKATQSNRFRCGGSYVNYNTLASNISPYTPTDSSVDDGSRTALYIK